MIQAGHAGVLSLSAGDIGNELSLVGPDSDIPFQST